MTASEVVLAPHTSSELEQVDPSQREAAVTAYLSQARDQLAHAVEMSGPAAVSAAAVSTLKAEIATAAEATRQLNLSKEIQIDAGEMVRRAEFSLGKAIRAGQERGEIRTSGQRGAGQVGFERYRNGRHEVVQEASGEQSSSLPSPRDFASPNELSASAGGIYDLVDGVEPEQFEEALAEARAEENVSRANVIRKMRGLKSDKLTPAERLNKIGDMADTGHTSDQIAKAIGNSEEYVRRLAKENGIEIRADKIMRGTRRVDHTRAVAATVDSLAALAAGLDQIDVTRVDPEQIENWVTSMKESIAALNRLRNNLLKEMTQ